ncbi:MAG: carbohydrate ABC transporter permease [Oscillospiraceae bacterium]|nr:carbohydrate ABC transporter permease [Oscillospiraceae bacterium]
MGAKSYRSVWGNALVVFFMGLVAVFMAFPLAFAIMHSLKPLDELFLFPPRFFVMKPSLKNFTDLFSLMGNSFVPFTRYFFNSIFVSVVGMLAHVVLSSMAAYPLSKHKFPGSKVLFQVIILSLMFTGFVLGIPRFIVMNSVGMIDTLWALLLPGIAGPLGFYLMRQFMTQVPDALIESARIDGASEFQIWWRIMMPNVKPAWLTLGLLAFQGFWGDTASVNLYIHTESMKTLPLAMGYLTNAGIARAGAGAAVSIVLLAPPLAIFIITQTNIIETMKSSGIKE